MFTDKTLYFIIIYIIVLILFFSFTNKYTRFICLFIIFVITNSIIGNDKMLYYICLGSVGAITEIIFIHFFVGTWNYKQIDFINIPLWLFPLWWIAAIFIANGSKFLKYH